MIAAVFSLAAPGSAIGGTQTFGYVSKAPQTFTVPDGVTQLSVVVQGARGGVVSTGYDPAVFGPDTRKSGMAGYAQGLLPVVPGQVLNVFIAQYGFGSGGWGWGSGGAGGLGYYYSQGNQTAYPGAGGGGASAILTGPNPQQILAVGGGGGGNGGLYNQLALNMPGGNGGNAGLQGLPGWDPDSGAPGGTSPNGHGRVGGCGACQSVAQGYEGESLIFLQPGGAGGGGGGGFNGGGGGNNGFRSEFLAGLAGSGGGGGSSFITSGAIDPELGIAPSSPCSMTASGGSFDPDCYGSATISWAGQPQAVTIQGAASADATIGGQLGDFTVLVTDKDGIPVPEATVTFSGPAGGASAAFAGSGNSTDVVTDSHGLATLAGLRANGAGGAWNLTATASGGTSPSARFSMTNHFDSSTTTLSANPDPSYRSQPAQIYATVAAGSSTVPPTGQVLFSIDNVPAGAPIEIGSANRATLPASRIAALDTGTHVISALYLGDSGHAGSQDTESQTVKPTPTSISVESSANPSGVGEDVTLTATVEGNAGSTGTPTGTVEFQDDDLNLLGTAPLDGSGKTQFSFEPDETVTVTAIYDGDALFAQSTGRYAQSVGPEATGTEVTSSIRPATYGQIPTWTAQVSRTDQGAALEGTVGFETADGVVCPDAELDADGKVTCTPTGLLDVGLYEVDAKYSPADDSDDKPSTGSFNQEVVAAPSQLEATVSPEPSVFGEAVAVGLGVTLPPYLGLSTAGTATLLIDGISGGDLTVTDGVPATKTYDCSAPGECPFPAGSNVVEADFESADDNILRSDAAVHHQVTAAPTSITVAPDSSPSNLGSPVTFTASVSSTPKAGTPGGRIVFAADGATIGDPVTVDNGKAVSPPIRSLTEGDHRVTASFLGTADYLPSGSSTSQRVTRQPDPVRGQPAFRLISSGIKVDRKGRMNIEMICGGDRGLICSGAATVRNRKSVRVARRGRKGSIKVRPGKLLVKRSLSLGAGDRVTVRFRLNGFGKRVLRATKKVPSLFRIKAKAGTNPTRPSKIRISSKVRKKKRK